MRSHARIQSPFPIQQRFRRLVWNSVWLLLFRISPRICFGWRRMLLRLFGARIDGTALVYNSTRIWAPWNLVMGPRSMMGDGVECYNVASVTLEDEAIASQCSYLCTAGHDIDDSAFPLVTGPITLRRKAWVCARAIVSRNVEIGEGAVVAIGAVVVNSVLPWNVVGGNPAKFIKMRLSPDEIREQARTP
jgi:putative colanic acid biosynthesis acetyltransferase WcaF